MEEKKETKGKNNEIKQQNKIKLKIASNI